MRETKRAIRTLCSRSAPVYRRQLRDAGDDVGFCDACGGFARGLAHAGVFRANGDVISGRGGFLEAVPSVLADLLKFKRTDFHLASQIAQAGYDCARGSVLKWLATSAVACTMLPDLAAIAANEENQQVRIGAA